MIVGVRWSVVAGWRVQLDEQRVVAEEPLVDRRRDGKRVPLELRQGDGARLAAAGERPGHRRSGPADRLGCGWDAILG